MKYSWSFRSDGLRSAANEQSQHECHPFARLLTHWSTLFNRCTSRITSSSAATRAAPKRSDGAAVSVVGTGAEACARRERLATASHQLAYLVLDDTRG